MGNICVGRLSVLEPGLRRMCMDRFVKVLWQQQRTWTIIPSSEGPGDRAHHFSALRPSRLADLPPLYHSFLCLFSHSFNLLCYVMSDLFFFQLFTSCCRASACNSDSGLWLQTPAVYEESYGRTRTRTVNLRPASALATNMYKQICVLVCAHIALSI